MKQGLNQCYKLFDPSAICVESSMVLQEAAVMNCETGDRANGPTIPLSALRPGCRARFVDACFLQAPGRRQEK